MAASGSRAGKSTSRSRRKAAREKADAGYDAASHPRQALSDAVDTAAIAEALRPVVEQFGLVLEEVTARGAGNTRTLGVIVDLPEDEEGSVSLDTIAEVSEAVSATLDETGADPEDAYLLEVGSPGATRKLTEIRHWKRSRGRLLSVTTTAGEKFEARLDEVEDAEGSPAAVIRRKKETPKGVPSKYLEAERLPLEAVAQARVEVEFTE